MFVKKYKAISDLDGVSNRILRSIPLANRRKAIKIAVIDDQKLSAKDSLKNYNYNIFELGDISSISDVEEYKIVLCDVMGVGKSFNPAAQGAELIKEIRKNYPHIYVLAYTGNLASNPQAIQAKAKADYFIDKDADMDEWSETLDEFINKSLDPVAIWKRARMNLVEIDTPTIEILELESAYVTGITKEDKSFSNLKNVSNKLGISGIAESVISGIITSAAVTLIGM